jgi:hypothetical protein
MGKPLNNGPKDRLIHRLAGQVGDKGMAIAILKKRGDLKQVGKHTALTPHGSGRAVMTAAQRAKDRASKLSNHPTKAYEYNKKTNAATLRVKRT